MAEEFNIDDIQQFPVLTHRTDGKTTRRPGGSSGPLGQTVDQALYEVLGWRPRAADPRGFRAALQQSFTTKERDGITGWLWTPHTYTVQADLGAVTGAQASLYKQALVIRDESVPITEGLWALRTDFDREEGEASRSIAISSIVELVDEFGLVGGPRQQRVNTLFDILLGVGVDDPTPDDPERVHGQLGNLRRQFGLNRRSVNTIEEEQNLTNYLILVDYVLSLRRTWLAQRHFFDRTGTDVYLGTQLVLLSRAVATLVDSVDEARDAMDSVFLGEVERQTIDLDLDGGKITIAELLAWSERFGAEEGPRLIREGGKEGVRTLVPTAMELSTLLDQAWALSRGAARLPRGFRTPRVQRAFEELTTYSKRILELAGEIAGLPCVLDVIPGKGEQGKTHLVTIKGRNLDLGPDKGKGRRKWLKKAVDFGPDIRVTPKNWSASEIEAKLDIDPKAHPGPRTVRVTNADGQSGFKPNAFQVTGPLLPHQKAENAGPEQPVQAKQIAENAGPEQPVPGKQDAENAGPEQP